jgi:hypothetical protein
MCNVGGNNLKKADRKDILEFNEYAYERNERLIIEFMNKLTKATQVFDVFIEL